MNSLRLLLVDGGSEKSEAISITLASANHTVLPTAGLDEASEALFVEQFDAVHRLRQTPWLISMQNCGVWRRASARLRGFLCWR